jgi:hypothetical protein
MHCLFVTGFHWNILKKHFRMPSYHLTEFRPEIPKEIWTPRGTPIVGSPEAGWMDLNFF